MKYLILKIDHLLTYNFLKRFFGIIRQVSVPNDHQATPTFLQLYRMLTVSSLIKPSKSGNCTIDKGKSFK